ncbi:MAG TPA: histidine phosphatase family protein [Anaerolineae bacterium]|nr:histidine phosphatase family protein [Anaerolineae bacterium]HQE98490.1 histidine phosphatase family protein [Anaerolineae bacterium]HQJ10891.1 histidine phosphatase family protein [Anaerolineae bacterium]
MESTTRLLFIRHGLVHNPDNLIYGRLPGFELSELGHRQAQAAAAALRATPLAALFSSPQLRARQTAAHVALQHPRLTPATSPWLDEIHIPLEGHPLAVAAARDWDLYAGSPPPYEQPADIVARIRAFVAEIRRAYAGQTVAAVTHGDVIAFAVLWALGRPTTAAEKRALHTIPGFYDGYPQTASITTFTFDGTCDGPCDGGDDRPVEVAYLRPYGAELLDDSAPK